MALALLWRVVRDRHPAHRLLAAGTLAVAAIGGVVSVASAVEERDPEAFDRPSRFYEDCVTGERVSNEGRLVVIRIPEQDLAAEAVVLARRIEALPGSPKVYYTASPACNGEDAAFVGRERLVRSLDSTALDAGAVLVYDAGRLVTTFEAENLRGGPIELDDPRLASIDATSFDPGLRQRD